MLLHWVYWILSQQVSDLVVIDLKEGYVEGNALSILFLGIKIIYDPWDQSKILRFNYLH
jgi:hypothetical protein